MKTPRVLLNDIIVSDESGFACSKTKLVENGLIHLRPFNLTNSGQLSLDQIYKVPPEEAPNGKEMLEEGDILFNNTNSAELVGKAALIEQPIKAGFSNHLTRIRVDQTRVMPQFMAYWFHRTRDIGYFSAQATRWVSQAAFKSSELRRMEMSLPPLEEQHRVVDILSRAEGIVRLRREAQKKAAEIIPALFLDMFGDSATNPKGWPMATAGDVIVAADYGSSKKASDNVAGVPMIRMGNVDFAGYLKLDDLKYVELSREDAEHFGLVEGDILFNRTNSKDLVGKTGIWDGSREAVAASYFIRVRVARNKVNPFFFWAFMNSAHMKRTLFETARGAIGQSNINARELRAFPIIIPPIDRQDIYEHHCRDVFSIQAQQVNGTEKSEAVFDTLLARTFNETCGGTHGTE
ncbi:MAG: restriction endonuclease subunit S [Syntrophobacteraceae bacterium]|nr:restriction endonuclease subunit S [Syntrophobacteraceae bacterium]